MLTLAVHTFRDRWPLFVGTLLVITLGVALVEASTLILQATDGLRARPGGEVAARDVESFMGLTLTISAFLSVFIIGSTFAFTVHERRRDLALLRLTGATRRQLRTQLAGESVVVGVLGSLAGLLVGFLLVHVQLAVLARLGLPAGHLHPRFSTTAGLIAFGVGVGLSVTGVWTASRRASRARPLDALRDVEEAARVMTVGRWLAGLFWAGCVVAGVLVAQVVADPLVVVAMAMLLIFTAALALQQFSPLLVPLVAALGGALARRHPEGELAHANLVDGRRRAATTAGPLIVLIGMVVGLYGVVLTQTEAQVRDLELGTRADLVVTGTGADVTAIGEVAGVRQAVPLVRVPATASWDDGAAHTTRIDVIATDPAGYRAVMTPRLRDGGLAGFGEGVVLNGDGDGPFAAEPGQVSLTTGGRTVTLPVAAVRATSLTDNSGAHVPLTAVDPALLADAPSRVMITVAPGAPVTQVRTALQDAGFQAQTTADWARGDQAAAADMNRTVTLGIAGLGGLYALIAVVNAVALAAAARRREFAVARLSGLTHTQVVRTSVLEALGVGVIGILLGAAAAAVCLWAVRRAFALLLGETILVIPWATLGWLAAVGLLAVAATAGVGSWVATRPAPISLAAARE